jgi:hypothetical protein
MAGGGCFKMRRVRIVGDWLTRTKCRRDVEAEPRASIRSRREEGTVNRASDDPNYDAERDCAEEDCSLESPMRAGKSSPKAVPALARPKSK